MWASLNWLLDAACLWVFIWSFGRVISPIDLLVAYGLANIFAAIPITPSGLGIIEGVLIGTLVGFGVPHSQAILAVLSYRLVNFWIPIPVGGISYASLMWRKENGSRLSQSPGPEQRQPFELTLRREVVDRLQAPPAAIGAEHPREEVVAPRDLEGLEQLLLVGPILDRHWTSTRRSRLRSMRSAEPSQIEKPGSPGVPKMKIRECSRNSPTRLWTVMFSESPATPDAANTACGLRVGSRRPPNWLRRGRR